MPPPRQRVAVIGAGISGLTAAYLLRQTHDVTVFEAEARPGGHANTVTLGTGPAAVHVDTGFIVYNETTYPGFSALLRELDVPTQPGDMSFGSTCERCGISFSSHGLGGLFAQRRNLLRVGQWRLLPDLNRFYRHARAAMARHPMPSLTLGQYAARFGGERPLVGHYLVPMAAAIWSAPPAEVLNMPFAHLARFLDNHGLIGWGERLQWRTVAGGSRVYVQRLINALPDDAVRTSAPVQLVTRPDVGGVCVRVAGADESFDAVVLACHADQALALLGDASNEERDALTGFTYTANEVVLHTDDSALPRDAAARASWNVTVEDCRAPSPQLAMTYDMNRLQALDGPVSYCVSVNPGDQLDPAQIISRHTYTHPRYNRDAVEALAATARIQGLRSTYFAGAHLGYGFHEDGYQSGARVAAALQDAL